jgi:hypothetical protein
MKREAAQQRVSGLLPSSEKRSEPLVHRTPLADGWLREATVMGRRTDCKRICGLYVWVALSDPGP